MILHNSRAQVPRSQIGVLEGGYLGRGLFINRSHGKVACFKNPSQPRHAMFWSLQMRRHGAMHVHTGDHENHEIQR